MCSPESILYTLLCQPFSYPFMQKAAFTAVVLGIVTGVVGAFVVVRGMAFFADALSHAVVPGIAAAYVIGGIHGPLMIGAMAAGMISAVVIGFFTRGGKIKEDTAVGIVLTGAVALGLALLSLNQRAAGHLDDLLIGNILAIEDFDLVLMLIVSAVILGLVRAFYKELMITSFDPVLGTTLRYPVEGFRYLLLVMLALTAVIAIQAVGAILITAMLVTPAATAYLLVKRMPRLMALSAIICAASGVIGVLLAWHLRVSASAAIVLTLTLVFLVTYLFAPGRGVLSGLRPRNDPA
jgi:ABC-type Mn2+/Zn2+ transport system permease subunit